ncbi:hypothetical protein [Bradyrhizobium sp. NC92]|uniref:hypothetical protein n=1 Tax=Bradyrhizobium sp. (strain NC92) TaxID=55395 RepID=UPI0021A988A7|nr:hypothetical protein [Bradyrhizobium sp. NC92]UWU68324.1 hypothetical protein N2602_35410 [Bradyrhizobium sp. NC92]
MPSLRGAKVYRSGVTAPKWNFETDRVVVNNFSEKDPSLHFKFEIASKGGGTTEVSLRVGSSSFDAILHQMYSVAPEQVVALMARQMNEHFWPNGQ